MFLFEIKRMYFLLKQSGNIGIPYHKSSEADPTKNKIGLSFCRSSRFLSYKRSKTEI